MGLLSRMGQRSLGLAENFGGRAQSGLGQTLHNVMRPGDYRGALPEWAPMARRGMEMVENGVSTQNRGHARQIAMDIRAMADRGDTEGAQQMLDQVKTQSPNLYSDIELILMQTSGR